VAVDAVGAVGVALSFELFADEGDEVFFAGDDELDAWCTVERVDDAGAGLVGGVGVGGFEVVFAEVAGRGPVFAGPLDFADWEESGVEEGVGGVHGHVVDGAAHAGEVLLDTRPTSHLHHREDVPLVVEVGW